ncbi:hypothetical protein V1523DRAFT_445478 [Lipomyces doorenjongii]
MVSTDTRRHTTPTSPRSSEKDVIDLKIDTDVDESLYELDSDNELSFDWYLDTGATSHVSGSIIVKLRKPNGSRCNLLLQGVFYVPEVRKNLLSGYRLRLEHIQVRTKWRGCALVKDNKNIIGTAKWNHHLLRLDTAQGSRRVTPQAMIVQPRVKNIEGWHERLGYLRMQSILLLKRKAMVDDFDYKDNDPDTI